MSKRTATTELNHENWDAEDDNSEEPGTFRRVSKEVLQTRTIRKAKRSLNSDNAANSEKSASPFAAFSGFSTTVNPFNQLKKSDGASKGLSPMVVDSQNITKTENGKSSAAQENKSQTDGNAPTTAAPAKQCRNIEYYRQLQSLNEGVLKWMELHLAKNACSDFTPVFNDYKKHLDTLNLTYPVQNKETEVKDSGSFKSFVFNKESSQSGDSNASDFKASTVKKESTSNDETDYGANFKANTTNTSTFSFGCKSTPTATSSVSPLGPTSSSKEEEKQPEKPFQFTFGGNKSTTGGFGSSTGFSFASAIAAKNSETAETEEEKYEPPKNDFVAVAEEDAIYSKKCKLFFKKDDSFADKGVGMLYLKTLEGKTQLLVRADTNLGNILLNIMLSASLPMSRTGKNNVLIVCVPNPPIDAKKTDSKEAIPMLIRVKTAEDADELLEILNKHKS